MKCNMGMMMMMIHSDEKFEAKHDECLAVTRQRTKSKFLSRYSFSPKAETCDDVLLV